ncbi:unnamed protein product [Soboliphyme baturini]|uniref:Transmembrane protein n=1 Tax=Soboliphyme baturini TaxID=241478 RepID=A0A183J0T9_9BILA|nr:unnamed protein product [Soboliphyme baturini]
MEPEPPAINFVYQEPRGELFTNERYMYIKAALCVLMASLLVSATTIMFMLMSGRFEYVDSDWTQRSNDVEPADLVLSLKSTPFATPAPAETQIPKPQFQIPTGNPKIINPLSNVDRVSLATNEIRLGDHPQDAAEAVNTVQMPPAYIIGQSVPKDYKNREPMPTMVNTKASNDNQYEHLQIVHQYNPENDLSIESYGESEEFPGMSLAPDDQHLMDGAVPHRHVSLTVTSNSDSVFPLLSLPEFTAAVNRFVDDVEKLLPIVMF